MLDFLVLVCNAWNHVNVNKNNNKQMKKDN